VVGRGGERPVICSPRPFPAVPTGVTSPKSLAAGVTSPESLNSGCDVTRAADHDSPKCSPSNAASRLMVRADGTSNGRYSWQCSKVRSAPALDLVCAKQAEHTVRWWSSDTSGRLELVAVLKGAVSAGVWLCLHGTGRAHSAVGVK
jgi:hypothetical protein